MKTKRCPECNFKLERKYNFKLGCDVKYCRNCTWNNVEKIRVKRWQYEYWYRLHRIHSRAHLVYPVKVKQPLDILKDWMFPVYAFEVPRFMKEHLESAFSWRYFKNSHWIFQSKSRWEYHLMMDEGKVESWAEYQELYKKRRREEAEAEEEPGYWDYWEEG